MADDQKNDDIDILEILWLCWGSKWIIVAFVFVGLLSGIATNLNRDRAWVSTIDLISTVRPTQPLMSKATLDFRQKFYSRNIFESWKQQVGNTALLFSDLDPYKSIDGVVLSADTSTRLIELKISHDDNLVVVARTDNLRILDGLFDYANHVNRLLTKEYLEEAQSLSEALRSILLNQTIQDFGLTVQKTSMDSYVASLVSGAMVYVIQPASVPKDVSTRSSKILLIFCGLMGILAVLFVLFRHGQTKRRNQSDTEEG